ncbi:hypothetical protein Poli38472_013845 [Pythium oligandrum]|uniref:Protein kinase domain-containing protein n=1 Tax=Pythium oligandrum TaxID=41045 RepID=A0A8K1C278_PYTOL|nr:hypothetical protein Poli38472_013845 [Pythium oligandrum]|eukprot:TMW55083.1 hypothetical protein Poli38472_013845 [Pythium oligandrum]
MVALRVPWLLPLTLLAVFRAASAETCPDIGIAAPDVVTLTTLSSDKKNAILIRPDCTFEMIPTKTNPADASLTDLDCSYRKIERVASLPSASRVLLHVNNLQATDFSKYSMVDLLIGWNSLSSIEDFKFPKNLRGLDVEGNSLSKINKGTIPDSVQYLYLTSNKLKSLSGISMPSSLKYLYLMRNQFSKLDLPDGILGVNLDNNPLTSLDNAVLPDSLESFSCVECGLSTIRGVEFPSSLKEFNVKDNSITKFEIRQSDTSIFNKVTISGSISQSSCEDDKAKKTTIKGNTFCVISDERFNAKYRGGTESSGSKGSDGKTSTGGKSSGSNASDNNSDEDTSDGESSGSGSSDGKTKGSKSSGGKTSSDGTTTDSDSPTKIRGSGSSDGSGNSDEYYGSGSSTSSGGRSKKSGADGVNAASTSSGSSGTTTTIVIIVVVVCAVLVIAAFVGRRYYAAKKDRRDSELNGKFYVGDNTPHSMHPTGNGTGSGSGKYYSGNGPAGSVSIAIGSGSQEYLSNDVRNDETLIPFRIAQDEIQITKELAKGGFGVIFSATYRGREVAVKQLLQDKARDHSAIKGFMDEVRMCAKLDHPKVVQFIGISWSNLLDVAVVIEYMAGGDLKTALHALPSAEPQHWYEPSATLKAKSLVALDTIEALVYLHSFESPILHRDLKARNVLLSAEGDAKLSDFGISREMSIDETMTGEIGTVAWIAPEVLQGERYSEKADIYSFGVLLVELDTCRHPYSKDVDGDGTTTGPSTSHTNTRIAMMVSAGVLKPSASRDAPRALKQLVSRCVTYNPAERPTAVEIHFELRNILERMSMTA